MRKSIYDIRDERKKEINKYGSNEIQTTKAKEFLQNTKIKDIINARNVIIIGHVFFFFCFFDMFLSFLK